MGPMDSNGDPNRPHQPVYRYGDGYLQTYSRWLLHSSSTSLEVKASSPAEQNQELDAQQHHPIWILYVHGGAWRDPSQGSLTALPAVKKLREKNSDIITSGKVAGVLSIEYRLSPYPDHPTNPSDPEDDQRNAKHPEHVKDVAAAVRYLKKEYGIKRWIGIGHSCGASLLCQLAAGIGLERSSSHSNLLAGLEGLILLEGIYDIPLLLKNHQPPDCPKRIAQIYRDFIEGAFGEDEEKQVYKSVSPTAGEYGRERWMNGRYVVVGYSAGDELVEAEQRDVLVQRFKDEGWSDNDKDEVTEQGSDRIVEARDLNGGHDEIWEDGSQIADLIVEVVGRLSRR